MSRPLKRKRAVDSIGAEEATGGMEDLLQDAAIDTRVALEMLAEQFPRAGAPSSAGAACAPCKLVPAPVVLKHQLYTVLADRTATDRELELLRSQGFVRAFKLNTPTHDEVVMLASDYDQVVRRAAAASGEDSEARRVLTGFADAVKEHEAPTISMEQIETRLGGDAVTLLMQSGFLVRHSDSARSGEYNLWVPGIGAFVNAVLGAREEILRMLRRTKYKEALQSTLEKRRLRSSPLGVAFHLKDMVGADLVHATSTTSGPLIRLPDP